jgi:hypothetical protein
MNSTGLDRNIVDTAPFGIHTLVCFERLVPSAV